MKAFHFYRFTGTLSELQQELRTILAAHCSLEVYNPVKLTEQFAVAYIGYWSHCR